MTSDIELIRTFVCSNCGTNKAIMFKQTKPLCKECLRIFRYEEKFIREVKQNEIQETD